MKLLIDGEPSCEEHARDGAVACGWSSARSRFASSGNRSKAA